MVVATAARAAAAVTVAAMATLAGTTTRDPMDKAPTAIIQQVALTMGTILNKSLLSSASSYLYPPITSYPITNV